jgi:integrase
VAVAERPRSRAKGEIKDVRAREEETVLPREHVATLFAYVWTVIKRAPSNVAALAENGVWLPLRNAFVAGTLLLTGLRRFELCGLACSDIDLVRGRLWTVGKNKVRDFVPLPDAAVDLLQRWLDFKGERGEPMDADAPVFATTGVGAGSFLSLAAARLLWRDTLTAAGVPNHYTLHSARHAAGMLVFAQTGSIERVARFLRHRSIRVTSEYYLHIDPDELRRELSNVDLWKAPPLSASADRKGDAP